MKQQVSTQPVAEPPKPRNGFALTGLIFGIAAFFLFSIGIIPILAVTFSAIGLARVKDRAGSGRAQAWTGLALGIVYTLVYLYHSGHLG